MPFDCVIAGTNRIDRANRVRARFDGGFRDGSDMRRVRRQFRNHRHVDRLLDRLDDLIDERGILSHIHAVTFGVRAGQIQFQPVAIRRESLRHADEFVNRTAENRNQQKAIRRQRDLLDLPRKFLRTRIRQTDRVHEAARRVLRENRLAVAVARQQPDAFRRDDTDLRNLASDRLDNFHIRRNHARRQRKTAGNRLA